MAVIVLEGPDESGKTLLANHLQRVWPEFGIVKSPAGSTEEWKPSWDYWANSNARLDAPLILDRTPEISEMVYGSLLRSRPRTVDPINAYATWSLIPEIALVFCIPDPYKLEEDHRDPFGKLVVSRTDDPDERMRFWYRYELLYQLFFQSEMEDGCKTFRFNYREDRYYNTLMARLHTWKEKQVG